MNQGYRLQKLINEFYYANHFTIYMYMKSSLYILNLHIFFQLSLNKAGVKNETLLLALKIWYFLLFLTFLSLTSLEFPENIMFHVFETFHIFFHSLGTLFMAMSTPILSIWSTLLKRNVYYLLQNILLTSLSLSYDISRI